MNIETRQCLISCNLDDDCINCKTKDGTVVQFFSYMNNCYLTCPNGTKPYNSECLNKVEMTKEENSTYYAN